jgi:transposase
MRHGKTVLQRRVKTEAVRQVIELRRPKAQVARDLGIHVNGLKTWLKAYAKDPVGAFTGESPVANERSEVARLQKELARVKAERDILKKAVAYFSKDQT